jgi:hypothetical protein
MAFVRIDVSEELSASIIRVTRIIELGTTLALTSNRCTLRPHCKSRGLRILHHENGDDVLPKRLFLQEPHGVIISQKTAFFIVAAVKASNHI